MMVRNRLCFVFSVLFAAALVVFTPRAFAEKCDIECQIRKIAEKDLYDAAIKEIGKDIASNVRKTSVSKEDRASITKHFSDTAKTMVKTFIDRAASGKLPEQAELVDAVMKEILPLLDAHVADILKDEHSEKVDTSSKLRVAAVYVIAAGDIDVGIKESVRGGLLKALADAKKYVAVESDEAFLSEVDTLWTVRTSNIVYDDRISEIGARYGIDFVCVVEITSTPYVSHVLSRMIDVKTAKTVSVGNAFNSLKSDDDIAKVSKELVIKMVGGGYTLTVDALPEAGGMVSYAPEQKSYDSEAQVSVTAVPNDGYEFIAWSGASESSSSTITVIMNNDLTLTANFQKSDTPIKGVDGREGVYTLVVSASPAAGGRVSYKPAKEGYADGDHVSAMAVPNDGYEFVGWSGASKSSNSTISFIMDNNITLTANFRESSGGSDGGATTMTGFSLGYGLSLDTDSRSDLLSLGYVYSRLIHEKDLSLNAEGDLWVGMGEYRYRYYDGSDYHYANSSFNLLAIDVPVTVMYRWGRFSVEAGLRGNVLFGGGETLFDAGVVAGVGLVFNNKYVRRCFYRYNGGFGYGAHVIGVWLKF